MIKRLDVARLTARQRESPGGTHVSTYLLKINRTIHDYIGFQLIFLRYRRRLLQRRQLPGTWEDEGEGGGGGACIWQDVG